MASKNQRKKLAASKNYIDQMNELAVSEGVKVKRPEEVKEYVEKGNTQ